MSRFVLRSRGWIGLPIALMVSIQVVSGLPYPSRLLTTPAEALGLQRETFGLSAGEATRLLRAVLNGLHLPVFAVLSAVWCWTLPPWVAEPRVRRRAALTICVLFAFVNEFSQRWVPHRLASWTDGLVDVCGVLIGLGLVVGVERFLDRRRAAEKRGLPVDAL